MKAKHTLVKRTRRGTLELTDFIAAVRTQMNVPAGASFEFTVTVPSGGDYSGHTLAIDDTDMPVRFSANWTEESE
jgi:hypothetical protein